MKFLLLLLIPILVFSQDVEQALDKLLNYKNIKSEIYVQYSPFKKEVINIEGITEILQQQPGIVLKAIFNNKAFINSRWYEKEDKLDGFSIVDISKNIVYMKKGNIMKNLKLENTKKYITVRKK